MALLPLPVLDATALASKLLVGSAALLPTDTLPALAAAPRHACQLWSLKQRPIAKPLILMAADAETLLALMAEAPRQEAALLIKQHWPGALTLVVPVRGAVREQLNPWGLTLGMRVPASEVTRRLLALSGPLATSSANLSGQDPCRTAADSARCFPGLPLLGPLPWPAPSGVASTVVTWSGSGCWQVLRQGAVITGLPPQPCFG
ncbi:MAG: L-threonylcarbamoyladenylate synthase [Prochlorococcus sp.]|nr:L-threonylcarbamoyladenylate synthase [Prochlorococcaceae cyanobacterium Fu_MAG_50]